MGLDMYLYKRLKTSKNPDGQEEIAYWRKANAIHGYFDKIFNGVEDTEYYAVSKEQLTNLLYLCCKVSEQRDNPDFAASVLPSTVGFFFGSYEYDDWYYEDIDNTIKMLTKILTEVDFDLYDVYYWAWW